MGEILLAVVVLAAVVAYGIGHIGNGARPTTATSPISSVATGATSPKNTITLSGDAVGSVRFGEAQSAAATSLVKLIGKSDGGMQKVNQGDCIISSALYWPNFAAYFYRGKFDGYQTGNYVTGKSEPTFNGVTPRGLRVDYTLAQAQKQYGSAFSTNGAQSGVYAAVTKTGTIRGYLSKEPNQAPATKVKLLTISAGSVGCPAMSPG
jgi:hypothetical protein